MLGAVALTHDGRRVEDVAPYRNEAASITEAVSLRLPHAFSAGSVIRASALFLRELLVDVAEEFAGTAEEAELVVRQPDSPVDLFADETHGANQVASWKSLKRSGRTPCANATREPRRAAKVSRRRFVTGDCPQS